MIIQTTEKAVSRLVALTGWRRLLAAFIAGLAAALALAPFYVLPLMALSFSGLILLLDACAQRDKPLGKAFLTGWAFGFGYFLIGIYWFAFSFFVQAEEFAWMAPFAVTILPAFLALFSGAAAALSVKFWSAGWRRVFLFAAIWAAFEYARGHVLTGLPWNLTGQALAGTAMGAQTVAWWGAYGLSLVAILIASIAAVGFGPKRGKVSPIMGALALIAGLVFIYGAGAVRMALPEPAPDGVHFVRIIQPNIPQREKIDPNMWARNFERQLELSKGDIPDGARLYVIWPENGAPLLNEAETALGVIDESLPENSVLLAGAVRRERNDVDEMKYYNSLMVIPRTPAGRRAVSFYDKHHLVPFGEYLPFYALLDVIGLAQLTPYGDAGFAAGKGPAVLHAGGPSFAPLICYEVIFPGALYPRGARPDWLVTVTNDAWFGDTSGPRQHLDMARLRSIESGLPMARAANTGISALIDAKGRILARVKLYQEGRIEAPLPPAGPRTLYDRLGDWLYFALTAGFLAFGLGLHNAAPQRKRVSQ